MAILITGTLDARPFCMKPSIGDALNSGTHNTFSENVKYYNEDQASGSNVHSSPPLLSLFPNNDIN